MSTLEPSCSAYNQFPKLMSNFSVNVCKTVRPMLSDRCLSVCPVCDISVSWPNGWMDQHETWRGGRSQPWPHCFRWNPAPPPKKGHRPQFTAHVCCGQMARWIKMPLGTEVDLGPNHIVLDGDPQKRGHNTPNLGPCIVAKRLHGSRCHLVRNWPRPG